MSAPPLCASDVKLLFMLVQLWNTEIPRSRYVKYGSRIFMVVINSSERDTSVFHYFIYAISSFGGVSFASLSLSA